MSAKITRNDLLTAEIDEITLDGVRIEDGSLELTLDLNSPGGLRVLRNGEEIAPDRLAVYMSSAEGRAQREKNGDNR